MVDTTILDTRAIQHMRNRMPGAVNPAFGQQPVRISSLSKASNDRRRAVLPNSSRFMGYLRNLCLTFLPNSLLFNIKTRNPGQNIPFYMKFLGNNSIFQSYYIIL